MAYASDVAVRPLLAALFVTLPLPGCQTEAPAKRYRAPGRYEVQLTFGGEARSFVLRVPKTFDGKSPLPVVFALHGWTSSGAYAERSWGIGDAAERNGFVLIAPNGLGDPPGWNAGFIDLGGKRADDVGFLGKILDGLPNEVPVDPKRVYLVGHSNGAMLAHYAGAKMSDRIAAVVGVSGTVGLPNGTVSTPDPKSPVSVLVVHGKKDDVVSYATSGRGLLKVIGAHDTAEWWATRDRTARVPQNEAYDDGTLEQWRDPATGTDVELLSLDEGGHEWPAAVHPKGKPAVPFTDFIWQFLLAHAKR